MTLEFFFWNRYYTPDGSCIMCVCGRGKFLRSEHLFQGKQRLAPKTIFKTDSRSQIPAARLPLAANAALVLPHCCIVKDEQYARTNANEDALWNDGGVGYNLFQTELESYLRHCDGRDALLWIWGVLTERSGRCHARGHTQMAGGLGVWAYVTVFLVVSQHAESNYDTMSLLRDG